MIVGFRKHILSGREPVKATDIDEWAKLCQDVENRRVAFDEVSGDAEVSTIFLGVDLSYGQGAPVLFETVVLGGRLDGQRVRYSTWDEAECGHRAMVERVSEPARDAEITKVA